MDTNKDAGEKDVHRQTTEQPLIEEDDTETTLTYRLESSPPIAVTVFTALQHILISLPGCLYTASVVSDVVCAPYDHPVRGTLFCGTLFMTGFGTFCQTLFGLRLPIFQGPSAAFLVPLLSLKSDPAWLCSPDMLQTNDNSVNATHSALDNDASASVYSKLQQMSGALMLASLFEILMGSIGLLGLLLRFIGPITVAITISLIGVSLAPLPIEYAKPSYPLALGCMVFNLILILYFQKVKIPIPQLRKADRESGKKKTFPLFQLMPILIGLSVMWFISWILTYCGAFTDDKTNIEYYARTDAKLDVVARSPWFHMPYPGMFGVPKLNIAIAVGFTIPIIVTMFESVGDYYAAQHACEVVTPPNHAISRGILTEGLGSLLSGAVGVGHATTSYSGNISILILSKNASRYVMYTAGILLMLMSFVGKVGAALTTIPQPILGGISILVQGTLLSIGFSNLKNVDMSSTRNLMVVGMPFMCGLTVPKCLETYPEIINTGSDELDRIIHLAFGSPMFLGGVLALILDNTAPGSYKSRGMVAPHQMNPIAGSSKNPHIYRWSIYPKVARVLPFLQYLPFLPPLGYESDENYTGVNVELSGVV